MDIKELERLIEERKYCTSLVQFAGLLLETKANVTISWNDRFRIEGSSYESGDSMAIAPQYSQKVLEVLREEALQRIKEINAELEKLGVEL